MKEMKIKKHLFVIHETGLKKIEKKKDFTKFIHIRELYCWNSQRFC